MRKQRSPSTEQGVKMSLSRTQAGTNAKSGSADDTELHGRWLLLARIVWVIVVLLTLGLFVASIPSYFSYLHILTATPTTDFGSQLARQDVQQLQVVGLSIDFYAWYSVIFTSIFVIVYSLVGLILFLRKSENRMALFASFTLVVFSIEAINLNAVQTLPSIGNAASMGINLLGSISLSLFFFLFPSGRFELRWIRWLAVVQVIYWTVNTFIPSSSPPVVEVLLTVLFLILAGSLVVVQIYRYRRLSNALERQQTKWVVFGISLGLGGYLIGILIAFGLLREVFNVNVVIFLICATFVDGLLLLFPISLGIAILRSRLWDIDIIINRTLVYGTLTAILALVYFGLIFALQSLFQGMFHQNNAVAIVISTLVIAALFQPLRHRLQRFIDRRFYRSKYDAAKTLEAFSVTLRNEVDLGQLREHLLNVVQETMQPAHVSLWLRSPEHDGTHQAAWRANPPIDLKEG